MQLSILQSSLDRALDAVRRVTGGKTVMPVTNCVLLQAGADGRLTLTGTNLEQTVVARAGAKVQREGRALVNARMLAQLVGGLPDERVDLTLTPKGLEIKCARSMLRLAVSDPEDMPPAPVLSAGPEARSLTLDPDLLREVISRVAFAAASDESRPVLTGVFCEVKALSSDLVWAAADGFRLNVFTTTLPEAATEGVNVIIPSAALAELARLLSLTKETEPVRITLDRNRVAFGLKTITLYAQLVQGSFPNYAQLIPKTHSARLILHAPELLAAVRTAAVFVENTVWLIAVTPNALHIRGAADLTGEGTISVDCAIAASETDNLPMSSAIQSNFLNAALAAMGDGKVALDWTHPSSPVVLRPATEGGAVSDDYLEVIMPMFSNTLPDAIKALQSAAAEQARELAAV